MKTILFISLLFFYAACTKDNESPSPDSNNQVKATVVLSSGDTIKINATGSKALMGCSLYGVGSYVDGISQTNSAVYITVYPTNYICVTNTGTYNFNCQYRPDVTSQVTPIYENQGVSAPGSITFTSISGNYAEGYFDAVCKFNGDSVIVKGTFKGHLQ